MGKSCWSVPLQNALNEVIDTGHADETFKTSL